MSAYNPSDWPRRVVSGYTYASKQATGCAVCGQIKHTPLRNDAMGGYVCLTCIDRELIRQQSERARIGVELGLDDKTLHLDEIISAIAFLRDNQQRGESE